MLLRSALLLPALFSFGALAVFADDAYNVDYHHALVGRPQEHTTFFQHPFAGSKASLIYTLSHKNVLGAINPKDGAIVWRQLLAPTTNATQSFLRSGEGQDTVISAVDGQVAAWSASDGRLAWELQFDGKVKDLEIVEQEDGKQEHQAKDAIVLVEGEQPAVFRLDGTTGKKKWTFDDNSGDAPFQLSVSTSAIHYIAHHGTFLGGYKLKIVTLDPVTGQKTDSYTLSSDSEISSPDSILYAGANTASPLLIWADKTFKTIKVNIVGTRNTASFNIENKDANAIEKVVVHAPYRITSLPHFLVHYQTTDSHWAEVYHVDLKKHTVTKAYELPKLAGKGAFATSTTDANVYFTRISNDEVSVFASTSHGILGRWNLPAEVSAAHIRYPLHAISEAVIKGNVAQAARTAITYSNGDWALLRNAALTWSRAESLAGVIAATFAPLPEEQDLAQQLKLETHQNVVSAYIHRVSRHVKDLQNLPAWLQNFSTSLLSSVTGGSGDANQGSLKKDTFGFHKLVIALTEDHRLITLDAGAAGKVLNNVDISSLIGENTLVAPSLESLPNGQVEITDAGLAQPIAVQIATGASYREYPDVVEIPRANIEYTLDGGEIRAYSRPNRHQKDSLWSFAPFKDETIVNVDARPLDDPVASIGKVLGDRRVLYKYLNPNLVLATAVSVARRVATIYLLDSVSGNLLYTATHHNVDTTRPIPSTLSENWLAYSYTTAPTSNSTSSRGYHLIIAELFESSLPDDRGPLGSAGNMSSLSPSSAAGSAKPYTLSQTYAVPEEISHLSVSTTKQGITSRALLAVLPQSHSIVSIPRMVIDPRRPVGRDPTSQEQMEGLLRYSPTIEFDPKWVLNHAREVFGVKQIVTAPSGLESTGLVVAVGEVDVFGTRVSPSGAFDVLGKEFGKVQMLGTVALLGVGVLVVAPMVRKKMVDAVWRL